MSTLTPALFAQLEQAEADLLYWRDQVATAPTAKLRAFARKRLIRAEARAATLRAATHTTPILP